MIRTRLWSAALAAAALSSIGQSTRAQEPPKPPPGATRAPAPAPTSDAEEPMTFRAARPAEEQSAPAVRPTRPTTMEQLSEASMQEIHIGGTKARYTLNFFGDVSFGLGDPQDSSVPPPDSRFPSFILGDQTFLLRGELGKHLSATTEWAFEIGDEVNVDVERMLVRYQTDAFYVEAGRSHTAFGYWNNAYHHGRWLQPTIVRPRWVAFEDDDGILPVHLIGINAGAKFKTTGGSLNLVASLGNGRGVIVDDVRNAGDIQGGKAVHLALEYVGLIWPDLRIGISGMYDRIKGQPAAVRPALPDAPIDELIGGFHIAYPSVPFLLIAEAYIVDHKHESQDWTTYGGFFLAGYNVGPITPYGEVERIVQTTKSDFADPFFTPNPMMDPGPSFDTFGFILGVRADLSDWTAIKAEYRNTRAIDRDDSVVQEGIINWSWGF